MQIAIVKLDMEQYNNITTSHLILDILVVAFTSDRIVYYV